MAEQAGKASPAREDVGVSRFFDFARYQAGWRGEIAGGLTTFLTMSYIIAVNPAILHAVGIPEGPAMTATIATAVFGCLAMGFIANRPFAIAPYMGENAFVAYTVVRVMGVRWEVALGSVFLAGVLFALLT
ncbi:MAG TPA: NCS2 family permease, partial [Candidatus Binataceae bacterium]|nr:NCS2 family permease [Candidatus Binataceae bacterium]